MKKCKHKWVDESKPLGLRFWCESCGSLKIYGLKKNKKWDWIYISPNHRKK